MDGFTFTDRARPIVQIGVGDSRVESIGGRWGTARWGDTDEWAGNDPVWFDRTCDVISIDITGGRLRASDRFDSATATIVVDNTTGWADQATDPGTILALRPGRPMRIGIDHIDYGRIWKFWGVIDQLDPTYIAHHPDEAVIVAVDMLADANRAKVVPTGIPFSEEQAGQRVRNILSLVPISNDLIQIDPTSVTVREDEPAGQVADLVHQAADSGGGVAFGAPDGRIYYKARDWQAYDPDTPPDATIGNTPYTPTVWGFAPTPLMEGPDDGLYELGAGVELDEDPADSELFDVDGADVTEDPDFEGLYELGDVYQLIPGYIGDVCPVSWDRPFSRADIATRVLLGRQDPPGADPTATRQFDDGPAQVKYGIEPFERTNLLTVRDVDMTELGNRWLLTRGQYTAPRIRSVSLDAATADNVVDLCTTVSPYTPSRYRCRLELARGVVFDRQHFVTRTRHLITRNQWLVDLTLDIADTYARAGARWGSARWGDTDEWAAS